MNRREFFEGKAVLLRKIVYGESSLIYYLFSREWGRIGFISKGALNAKNHRLQESLEIGNLIEISFLNNPSGSLQIPKNVRLLRSFPGVKENYVLYGMLCNVLKEINTLIPDHQPHSYLFDLLVNLLDSLENSLTSDISRLLVNRFRLELINELGFFPSVEECFVCGKKSDTFLFSQDFEGFVCSECSKPSSDHIFLSKGDLEKFFNGDDSQLSDINDRIDIYSKPMY
jgi:DNA repair protein RecO (recombination protein O)